MALSEDRFFLGSKQGEWYKEDEVIKRSFKFCKLFELLNSSSSLIKEGLAGCRLSSFFFLSEIGLPVSSPHSQVSSSVETTSSYWVCASVEEPIVECLFFLVKFICPSLILMLEINFEMVVLAVSIDRAFSKSSKAYSKRPYCS